MASTSSARTKRAVAASRVVADDDDEVVESNYGLKLTQALEAIEAANGRAEPEPVTPQRFGRRATKPKAQAKRPEAQPEPEVEALPLQPAPSKKSWLQALDQLPPIRLPIGPAIPWRIGLPLLLVVLVAMAFVYRPTAAPEDRPGVRLPTQETYAVQTQSPLFAASNAQQEQPAQPEQAQPLGVAEPTNAGMDVLDVGLKLVAVLALAYGSLLLLKRIGMGGPPIKSGSNAPGVRIVTSLSLGQNRSVHVLKLHNGKTLLVGATPTQVNLIADLGEISDDDATRVSSAEAASFFDVLSAKLPRG